MLKSDVKRVLFPVWWSEIQFSLVLADTKETPKRHFPEEANPFPPKYAFQFSLGNRNSKAKDKLILHDILISEGVFVKKTKAVSLWDTQYGLQWLWRPGKSAFLLPTRELPAGIVAHPSTAH